MNSRRLSYALYWLLWVCTALPIVALAIFMFGEIPMWPDFQSEATAEGTALWAVLTAWIYLPPIALIASRQWWLRSNDDKEEKYAQN